LKNLSNINTVKSIVKNNNFKFSKGLGQNFIVAPEVCPKMAEACNLSEGIIEIGPGIGTLTLELAKRFKKVVAIEIDKRLIPILNENLSEFKNAEVIQGDILKINIKDLIASNFSECKKISICANLPYYITSEVIMHILESEVDINSIVLMIQKEAAERICALPGTRKSGAISLAVRYFGIPEILFDVKRECFVPAPKVDSSVIKIDLNDKSSRHKIKNKRSFFKVVRAAYSQRRKNLLNSLSRGLGISKEEILDVLMKANINSCSRAENLTFDDFAKLSNLLFEF